MIRRLMRWWLGINDISYILARKADKKDDRENRTMVGQALVEVLHDENDSVTEPGSWGYWPEGTRNLFKKKLKEVVTPMACQAANDQVEEYTDDESFVQEIVKRIINLQLK